MKLLSGVSLKAIKYEPVINQEAKSPLKEVKRANIKLSKGLAPDNAN